MEIWRFVVFALPFMIGCNFIQKMEFRTIVHPVIGEVKRNIDYYREDKIKTANQQIAVDDDGRRVAALDALSPGNFPAWLEDVGNREEDYGLDHGGIVCPDSICMELTPDEAKRFTLYLLEREKFLEWYALREDYRKDNMRREVREQSPTVIGVTKMWSVNSDLDEADGIRLSYEFGGWSDLYSGSFVRIDLGGYLNREYESSGSVEMTKINIDKSIPFIGGPVADTLKSSEFIEIDLFLSSTIEMASLILNPANANWLQFKIQLRAGAGVVIDNAVTFTDFGISVLGGTFENLTVPSKLKTVGYFSGFFYAVVDLPLFVRFEFTSIVNEKESRFDYSVGVHVPF
jgi:hypothetical protein